MNRPNLPFLYALSIPYVAAVVPFKMLTDSGLSYTSLLWMSYLIFGIFLILLQRSPFPFPWKLWLPWFLFISISFFWSSKIVMGKGNLQILLQMFTPFVVGIVSSFSITNEIQWRRFMLGFSHCLLIIVTGFLFFSYGPISGTIRDLMSVRPAAMTLAVIAAIYITKFEVNKLRAIMGWLACLVVSALTGGRAATFTILFLWPLSPSFKKTSHRILFLLLIAAFAIGLFSTQRFQERFFHTGEGTISDLDDPTFNDAGRFDVWTEVWNASKKHTIIGAGVGESRRFVSSQFDSITLVHNEYLWIIFEFGFVGLVIYLTTMGRQMIRLWLIIQKNVEPVKTAAVSAFLSICAWLLLALTDNGIIYGLYFTHPIFAIIGATYGLERGKRKIARTTDIEGSDR